VPWNGSNVALLGDIADVATSVATPVASRARAQALVSNALALQSKWEVSRDNGATWTLYKLGAERVATDTSFYSSQAAAQAAGLWTLEGDLPPLPPRTAAHCCASRRVHTSLPIVGSIRRR
jgi:hypothetical protein